MIAPLATLAFLTVLWVVNLVIADLLERGIGKTTAALKGHSPLAVVPIVTPIAGRVSQRSRQRALRAQPQLRADLRAAA